MPFVPQSQAWPGRRALVLVHGVGSYAASNYDHLLEALEQAVGPAAWAEIAVYTTLYDVFNDWAAAKVQCAAVVDQLVARLRFHFETSALGEVAAESVGDIVWPVLYLDARRALRDAIAAQLERVVLDGDEAGVDRPDQKISIVCHSLGCFHTFETLAALAAKKQYKMQPVGDGVQFDNVLMFASPVQLIRSVSGWLGNLVPLPNDLACLRGPQLTRPGQLNLAKRFVPSARRLVSITGELDPVGGYLLRRRLAWAYMDLPEQESHVDPQQLLPIPDGETLAQVLREAIVDPRGLAFTPENPHDWVAYVERNQDLVKECLLS